MKKHLLKIKYFAMLMALSAVNIVAAQSVHREFRLKNGDTYRRQVLVRSNSLLQRGGQRLNLSTYSNITKIYKVTGSDDRQTVNIIINKIVDSIDALGQWVIFDSDKRPDPNSYIQTALSQLVGKTASVTVDEDGKILSVQKRLPADDTVLSFTGIQNENFVKGNLLDLTTDLPAGPMLKKDLTWTDSTANTVTKFTVYAVNSRTTTITYATTDHSGNLNSRINGVLLVENGTGLVLKRSTQSVTTGYELVKGVIYTATRRTATTEICYKITGTDK
jgi:hypothetical protein